LDIERARDVREWFDSLDKENLEIHPLSVGSGLESLLKPGKKDETLKRFINNKHINPEETQGNTVEKEELPDEDCENDEEEEDDDNYDKNQDCGGRPVSPNAIRKKLFEERRKTFARRWFTKYNYFQKMRE
jgi:hypothetical protein